jgi:hypothetical protein
MDGVGTLTHSCPVELGVIVGRRGRDIPVSKAAEFISGYTLALDITARNLQEEAKKTGGPWTLAKGFDTFTPLSRGVLDARSVPDPQALGLRLEIDGKITQNGHTSDMIFSVKELLAYVSSVMTLEPGDLILTGMQRIGLSTMSVDISSGVLKAKPYRNSGWCWSSEPWTDSQGISPGQPEDALGILIPSRVPAGDRRLWNWKRLIVDAIYQWN